MTTPTFNQVLTHSEAIKTGQSPGEDLVSQHQNVRDTFHSMITSGIHGAYQDARNKTMRDDVLTLGKAFLMWDPAQPDLPLSVSIRGTSYEISEMHGGGLRLLNRETGQANEFDTLDISSIRNMILSDLMNHPDFSEDMERSIYEDPSFNVDLAGMERECANACGQTSTNIILAYHGLNYASTRNPRYLIEIVSVYDIIKDLRKHGLRSRALQKDLQNAYTTHQIQRGLRKGPLLCKLRGHFVVVHRVNTVIDRVDIFCPLLGNRHCSLKNFNDHLDWDQDADMAPLMQFSRTEIAREMQEESESDQTRNTELDLSFIDSLGLDVSTRARRLGSSWLDSPSELPNAND
jgi:hypothetical protein